VRLRETLVDDAHGRRAVAVALLEDAALEHANPHHREVVRADARDVGGRPLARRRLRLALDAERALPAAQERQRRGSGFHARLALELGEHALEERAPLGGLAVPVCGSATFAITKPSEQLASACSTR
jgi:hypothetical protein